MHLSPWLKFCPQPFGVNPKGLAQQISLREIWLARYFFSHVASDRATNTLDTPRNKVAQYPPCSLRWLHRGYPLCSQRTRYLLIAPIGINTSTNGARGWGCSHILFMTEAIVRSVPSPEQDLRASWLRRRRRPSRALRHGWMQWRSAALSMARG